MKFNVRVVSAIVGIALVATACGSTKTVAVPGPTVLVTPTPTVTAPAPQRDVADLTKPVHPFVELESKGTSQGYALAFANSGSVNLHLLDKSSHPMVSSPVSSRLLIGTYVTVHCYERGDLVVNDVGRSSDVWYYISLSEGMDGFTSSVFIDSTSGDRSWDVPACPVGFGSDPNVAAESG